MMLMMIIIDDDDDGGCNNNNNNNSSDWEGIEIYLIKTDWPGKFILAGDYDNLLRSDLRLTSSALLRWRYRSSLALKFRKRARTVDCTKIDRSVSSCRLEIVLKVREGSTPPFRPKVSDNACTAEWMRLMTTCWSETPEARPQFDDVLKRAQLLNGGQWVNSSYLSLLSRD